MHNALHELEQFLDALAREARPGDRLPTIRALMRRFGVSQAPVQRAFQVLKDRGQIESQVGRGTYFTGGASSPVANGTSTAALPASTAAAEPDEPAARGGRATDARAVLLLRRSISIARGRVLVEGLHRRFAAEGHRVLEVSYTDAGHALTVLKALPRFDACVVQSTFRTIPVELLAALREKCAVLAVDGTALVGTDVEAVGTEWGEPLAAAVELLWQQGHRHIAFACTAHPFLATQLGWRRFESLQRAQPDLVLEALALPLLPDDAYAEALAARLAARRDAAEAPLFSALVAWGIEDGERFRALLADVGLAAPDRLSVVLLGRTDLANEHAGFFTMAGCSVEHQVAALHEAIQARWAQPQAPYGVRLIPLTQRAGASVAALTPAVAPVERRARGPRSRRSA
ncbi:winged helix-turn-helix domain-containing protein [Aquabacterium sp.]|uniref:winged helix-turn-helix domain-containing protein n=1 Tax=Aquabacterium sp. TaxID=1872578 RepID=UPI003783F052